MRNFWCETCSRIDLELRCDAWCITNSKDFRNSSRIHDCFGLHFIALSIQRGKDHQQGLFRYREYLSLYRTSTIKIHVNFNICSKLKIPAGHWRRGFWTYRLRFVRRYCPQNCRELPCSLYWWTGRGKEGQTSSLQGKHLSQGYSQFYGELGAWWVAAAAAILRETDDNIQIYITASGRWLHRFQWTWRRKHLRREGRHIFFLFDAITFILLTPIAPYLVFCTVSRWELYTQAWSTLPPFHG